MIVRLIQFALLFGSVLMAVLVYSLFIHYQKVTFSLPNACLFIGIVAAYSFGAVAFLSVKGIHFFSKSE